MRTSKTVSSSAFILLSSKLYVIIQSMDDLKVQPITAIKIQKVLSSTNLTDAQKAQFLKENAVAIKEVAKTEITKTEFVQMMKERPLIRFRPFKNSFTKQGDRILLAKSLGIEQSELNSYIDNVFAEDLNSRHHISKENIDKIKTYVYRHGKKGDVVRFLDYELSDAKHVLNTLYKTMADNSGGMADYFSRPMHRMDNKTLVKLYGVIDNRLRASKDAGFITEDECNSTAQWALVRIYEIQNNSKLIRAYKLYKDIRPEN